MKCVICDSPKFVSKKDGVCKWCKRLIWEAVREKEPGSITTSMNYIDTRKADEYTRLNGEKDE